MSLLFRIVVVPDDDDDDVGGTDLFADARQFLTLFILGRQQGMTPNKLVDKEVEVSSCFGNECFYSFPSRVQTMVWVLREGLSFFFLLQ
jgi:hypothetical protein